MKSIIQDEKVCFLTGYTQDLDEHHIFFGPCRDLSEKYGLKVWLRHDRHIQDSKYPTPHNCRELDLQLKQVAREAFEREYPDLDFMAIFGKEWDEPIESDPFDDLW